MRPSPSAPIPPQGHASDVPVQHVTARAPTRIDFGGGWTDVPPYPERDGGYVCNVAITRHARVRFAATPGTSTDPLAAAALAQAEMTGTLTIESDYPMGAGLGGSSAAGVAIQAAIAVARGEQPDAGTLVTRSRAVEVERLGIAGGWQDHYAAAHGGALGLDFGTATRVDRIALDSPTIGALQQRCLLLFTGESRISARTITAVLDAYGAREPRVLAALQRMAALAREMAAALRSGDVQALGGLVAEHWIHQRSLHPAISTERIDAIAERAAQAGALATKALGASGGGCVVILTPDDPTPVRAAVGDLGTFLSFAIDTDGVAVEEVA